MELTHEAETVSRRTVASGPNAEEDKTDYGNKAELRRNGSEVQKTGRASWLNDMWVMGLARRRNTNDGKSV